MHDIMCVASLFNVAQYQLNYVPLGAVVCIIPVFGEGWLAVDGTLLIEFRSLLSPLPLSCSISIVRGGNAVDT